MVRKKRVESTTFLQLWTSLRVRRTRTEQPTTIKQYCDRTENFYIERSIGIHVHFVISEPKISYEPQTSHWGIVNDEPWGGADGWLRQDDLISALLPPLVGVAIAFDG